MLDHMQLITASAGEFRVESKHLYREVDFVGDALSSGLGLGPKLKIFRAVIRAYSIFVVRRLSFNKRATEQFRHYKPVFEFFSASPQINSDVPSRMQMSFGIYWTRFATFVAAFCRAIDLCSIVTRVLAVFGLNAAPSLRFAAEFALKSSRRSSDVAHACQFTACREDSQYNLMVATPLPGDFVNSPAISV